MSLATELQDDELQRVIDLVRSHTGIHMDEGKRKLLHGRLIRRLRSLGIDNFRDYCDEISQPDSEELQLFINAVTTNLTSFYREAHHFQHLADQVLPKLVKTDGKRSIRIWSAGCSSGAEPYSIAMTLDKALSGNVQADWKILATDLDSSVLATARAGIYDSEQIERVTDELRRRYFHKGIEHNAGKFRISAALRSRVVFKQLNLMDAWPMREPLDAIFCRNVAIYFDRPTQARLFERLAEMMAPGGALYIGHSESLHGVSKRFRLVGKTVYERVP